MTGIAINGKFMGATLNGVHRTAALYSAALLSRQSEGPKVEIVAPRSSPPDDPLFAALAPKVVEGPFGTGQFWEMITLPRATRGRLLVNFCNLGPLVHSNSVVMIHDTQTFMYPQDYSGRQAVAYRMLLPIIGKRARLVLTVSEFAKASLVEYGVAREEKIEVVHNGGDHLLSIDADENTLSTKSLKPTGYALAFGSTKSYKNLGCLFEAFRHPALADLPLAIAGGPPKDAYRSLGYNPPPTARFLGSVSDGELRALYQNAAMFLFPSKTEGFGLPPIEALNFGCPVIAARAGAIPEVCGEGALLIDPNDVAGWIDAIQRFRHADQTLAFQAAARDRARHFTWSRAGDRLWEVLSALVD